MKKIKSISIQPAEMPDHTLPYPFHIDSKGLVLRQDFWEGKPYRLLGFSKTKTPGTIDFSFKQFWKDPKICLGRCAVMADKEDNWYTYPDRIENYHINN